MPTSFHRRILGDLWPPSGNEGGMYYTRVVIARSVRQQLRRQLTTTGQWRFGLVYGYVADEALHIWAASPPPPPGPTADAYFLGFTDALMAASDSRMDWQGLWAVHPSSLLPDDDEAQRLFEDRQTTGWFAAQRVLLTFGLADHTFTAVGYRSLSIEDAAEPVPAHWHTT